MKYLPDLLTVSGVSLLSYGLWLYYEPLSYIIIGSLFLVGGLMLGKNLNEKKYQKPMPPPTRG